tara:strand:+ start:16 stop:198 length:183 start_codon:yes stop_codon:yes gene_type:complete
MNFSWAQHLELSRAVTTAADRDQGLSLALMGLALTLLAKDLLAHELDVNGCPMSSTSKAD